MARTLSWSSTTPAKTSRLSSSRSRRRRWWEIQKETVKRPRLPLLSAEDRSPGPPGSSYFDQRIPCQMRSLLLISFSLSLCSVLATTRPFKTRFIDVWRPRNYTAVNAPRTVSEIQARCHSLEWDRLSVSAPDVTDQYTLSQLGRIAANAYAIPGAPNWWDLDPMWSTVRIVLFTSLLQSHNLTP